MAETLIEWADRVWNFLRGCSMVSPGCAHCYAMKQAHRFSGPGMAYEGLTELGPDGPRWTGKIRMVDEKLLEPLSVKRPQKWFVNSMSDLFHEDVPFSFIDKAFAVMALCSQHTFQILTKRPERMREYFKDGPRPMWSYWIANFLLRNGQPNTAEKIGKGFDLQADIQAGPNFPLKNVWLGVSVENQKYADERIPILLQTPAAVRFVSYEPALGQIDITRWVRRSESSIDYAQRVGYGRIGEKDPLDWIIVGGESGPGARPFNIQWAKDVIAQCKAAGVACFVKQLGTRIRPAGSWDDFIDQNPIVGAWTVRIAEHPATLATKDKKGGDWDEWPEDLKVREFPNVR